MLIARKSDSAGTAYGRAELAGLVIKSQANLNHISLLDGTTISGTHSPFEAAFRGHLAVPTGILWARFGPILGRRAAIQRPDSGLTHCEIDS